MARTDPKTSRRPARRRAMTLVELTIGMIVTSLVIAAVSALWFGVCRTWQQGNGAQNVALTSGQANARLEATFRAAKYVFQATPGSIDGLASPAASIFYWKGDNWAGTSDFAVEIGELALVEHDPVAKRLYLYQALPYVNMDAGQKARAGLVVTWADLQLASTKTTFKSYDFVQKTVVSESVVGALFGVPTATGTSRPMIEFTLSLKRTDGTALVYGAAALRGPTTRPL